MRSYRSEGDTQSARTDLVVRGYRCTEAAHSRRLDQRSLAEQDFCSAARVCVPAALNFARLRFSHQSPVSGPTTRCATDRKMRDGPAYSREFGGPSAISWSVAELVVGRRSTGGAFGGPPPNS